MEHSMNVLVVDIGGTHVKVLASGHKVHREFDSGPTLTPKQMVAGVKKLVADWKYGGKMLFLGLGTGLGSAMIVDGIVEPMELGHLPYKKATFEDYVGIRGVEKYGKNKWRSFVTDVVKRLIAALEPDDVVLGGGNVKKLKELPSGSRVGDNDNAFLGGFRVWKKTNRARR
jgi:polyphosphate glucokinase